MSEPADVLPGVYGIPAEQYHADPIPGGSLSVSGAKRLLPPGCPALFKYERDNGRLPKRHFDLGHAAHTLVLGAGPPIAAVDAADWRTAKAKELAAEAREAGAVPLLAAEYAVVQAMAAALRAHPTASLMLDPECGSPEQSLFWKDRRTGQWLRARLDFLRTPGVGRMVVPDYKTAACAAHDKVQRSLYDHRYYMQAPWYLDGLQTLGLAGDDAIFVFVVQEKTPPYLVNVVQPDDPAMAIGRLDNRSAVDLYVECASTDRWPGYGDDITPISLPRYVENLYAKELSW
jgi:PDDEXK-like domain of unknown function (DUF3799)